MPLGVRGANIDSALNCVYSFSGQFIMGIRSWDSGCRLRRPVSTHFSVNSFKSSHTGIGTQELGFCLWASGEQTLLGIKLCILFRVNSLRGSVHGIQDFASGRAASTHCSVNCVCSFSGQLGSWDLEFCLWVPGDQTLLGIELHMQLSGQFITGIG